MGGSASSNPILRASPGRHRGAPPCCRKTPVYRRAHPGGIMRSGAIHAMTLAALALVLTQASPLDPVQTELGLTDYSLQALDLPATPPGEFLVVLDLGDARWTLDLRLRPLRAEGFRLREARAGGEVDVP